MIVDEIFHLATIRGPHAGSGCVCNQCRQAEALVVAVQEIKRLRTEVRNCQSPEDLSPASAAALADITKAASFACIERMREDTANAVDETERWKQAFSDHENDRNRREFALRAALTEVLRMAHPATAGSYTDDHKRAECERLTKALAL